MKTKREAINVLMTTEINDGLKKLSLDFGMTKSRMVRFICMEYLNQHDLLPLGSQSHHQHLLR
jgi:hypothetical protein